MATTVTIYRLCVDGDMENSLTFTLSSKTMRGTQRSRDG